MRRIRICLLKWDGTIEWRVIQWGKRHLDYHRKDGDVIFYFEEY
jgi:hypothetical protein